LAGSSGKGPLAIGDIQPILGPHIFIRYEEIPLQKLSKQKPQRVCDIRACEHEQYEPQNLNYPVDRVSPLENHDGADDEQDEVNSYDIVTKIGQAFRRRPMGVMERTVKKNFKLVE
jgi:hypothetical protein